MIGPLPISNETVARPLDYMYNENATMEFPNCVQREPFEGLTSPNETLEWNGQALPHDDLTAPIAVAPDGARYEFDPVQNYISWSMCCVSRSHLFKSTPIWHVEKS